MINLFNKNTLYGSMLIIIGFAPLPGNAAAEVAIIAGKQVQSNAVSAAYIKKIFLGKKRSLPDGYPVKPVDQREDSSAYKEFYSKVVNKKASQLKSYWSKMIFSGKARPPKVVGNDAQVKNWVKNNPGSIGYISSSSVDASVKVLLRVR